MIPYAMSYSVAVGLPVALAATAFAAILRHHGRPERVIWMVALAAALALPAVMLLGTLDRPEMSGVDAPSTVASGVPGGSTPDATGVIGLPEFVVVSGDVGLGLGGTLLLAWLVTSLALLGRWALAAHRLRGMARGWRRSTLDGLDVWMTEDLGPAVAGAIRPRVLVPSWLLSLPAGDRSLILAHEQEHVRARDPWAIFGARVARVLTPWNPVVWLLSARLVRAVELDCDRRVLRRSGGRIEDVGAYGRTLLAVAARGPGRFAAAAAFAETEAPLRTRILAMTTPSRTISVLALVSATVLGVVLLVGALEIPVPTVRIAVELGPRTVEAAPTGQPALLDQPTVPQQPPAVEQAGIDEAGRGVDGVSSSESTPEPSVQEMAEAERVGRVRMDGAQPPQAGTQERPRFTPFTLAPRIINVREVQDAMIALYPSDLREAGIGGRISVWFFIDEEGLVRDRHIERSTGHEALDRVALQVAEVYRFTPAMNRDQRVPVWVSLPINFLAGAALSTTPQPTPFTTPPRLLNVDEIREAMIREYPALLRDAGVGGTVRVDFFVDATGTVGNALIDQSSGNDALDRAALSVARAYRFDPALNRDTRVPVWISLPISFEVQR